ncbi:class I SAM-dependent methyltransferase [[Clostridium] symbiosum]|uniref:class I SAM-dependent methyltransferase n=1 Tax=Clostridium symbiosum TaxID=1512 RepID=UPI001D094B44|nr:class I SAM-dependent methyltransferase [[Clostridium] symbiosum]MCB6611026.1 class I SAM-dependent methyltransferase [[Clostridium] symbiosum]MCB6931000.1 class I SAM-dependent methyltransferase [[Clostridium] symbiosum]
MQDSLNYYNEHAREFSDNTIAVDFKNMQDKFLAYLEPGSRILDFGCGSGRDTKYFLSRGYDTDASDGSEELVKIASEYTGIQVRRMLFQELDVTEKYDGIWACSSILHLPYAELADVIIRMGKALVLHGIAYTSFKYGNGEGVRNGRFFTDMTEEKITGLLNETDVFKIEEIWITSDVRPGREVEKWLNLILRKK